jgi:hypothetical protein
VPLQYGDRTLTLKTILVSGRPFMPPSSRLSRPPARASLPPAEPPPTYATGFSSLQTPQPSRCIITQEEDELAPLFDGAYWPGTMVWPVSLWTGEFLHRRYVRVHLSICVCM